MTQLQNDYPRDVRNQVPYVGDAMDFTTINQRLRSLNNAINNIPGTTEWLYVGKDVPFIGAWSNYRLIDRGPTCPRFRRVGYDTVEIEGLTRQNPFNGAAPNIFLLPEGFIPGNAHYFATPSAAGPTGIAIYGYQTAGVAPGLVQHLNYPPAANTDYLSLDNIHFSLQPSRY